LSLAADVSALLTDLLGLGLACRATYGAATITVAITNTGQPPEYDAMGEITRREGSITAALADMPAPLAGQQLVVASGPWAGIWTITSIDTIDDGAVELTARQDAKTSIRSPGGRRLPGEA
jgi:hypothetical protein